MACELTKEDIDTFPGVTLFSKSGNCLKPTGVYIPPAHAESANTLNVVIWLHGFYVNDHRYLFHGDPAQPRRQVLDSGRDIVLIAPFLGHAYVDADGNVLGNYNVSDLGRAKWGESYLDGVLGGLARAQNPSSASPLSIQNLFIACHSGGGSAMRKLVGTLGKYQSKLKECWGFDCLYQTTAPDDATFWYDRTSGKDGCPLYVYFGPSTIRQSVKLDLMGRGQATREGNRANPPRPRIDDIHVTIGHYEAYSFGGQTTKVSNYIGSVVDDLMTRPVPIRGGPPAKPPKPKDGDFVETAARNLKANYIFPDDVHYFIARAFFLSRLRNAAFN
jgi:hypothetical protein